MKNAIKNNRYFVLSIATLLVMLMVGCSSSNKSESSVTDESLSTMTVTPETETVTTTSTAVITEETTVATTTVPTDTMATDAELTAPTPPDLSGDIIQINLDKLKESYDTSYGEEIACATMVLNYLGFNVDETTLATYLPPSDGSSYIPSSAIKSAIESYFADIGVQYDIIEDYLFFDFNYFDGYPSIVWSASEDYKSQQCFVLVGSQMVDSEHFCRLLYDPTDNTIKKYPTTSVFQVAPNLNLIIKPKIIKPKE